LGRLASDEAVENEIHQFLRSTRQVLI